MIFPLFDYHLNSSFFFSAILLIGNDQYLLLDTFLSGLSFVEISLKISQFGLVSTWLIIRYLNLSETLFIISKDEGEVYCHPYFPLAPFTKLSHRTV